MAQWVKNLTIIQEDASLIPWSLIFAQWLKDPVLPQASAQVTDEAWLWGCCGCGADGSCSSNSMTSLGTSICCKYSPKKKKKNVLFYINKFVVICYDKDGKLIHCLYWEYVFRLVWLDFRVTGSLSFGSILLEVFVCVCVFFLTIW